MILTPKIELKNIPIMAGGIQDTLYTLFLDACEEAGNKEALLDPPNRNEFTIGDPRRLTFNDVKKEVDRFSSKFFDLGFRKDDKVILQLPNIVELAILYIALSKIGVIISPAPIQYGKFEIEKIIKDIGPKGFIGISEFNGKNLIDDLKDSFSSNHVLMSLGESEGFIDISNLNNPTNLDELNNYVDSMDYGANDLLTICWTSGTTGSPKGCQEVITYGEQWLRLLII